MTPRDFCYWLQGMLEIGKPTSLSAEQLSVVQNHLNLVFKHEIDTPDLTGMLQAAHDGEQKPKPPLDSSGKPTLYRC